MSYDQAYWHTETCIKMGLPDENAATHIVAYLNWCIHRKLLSDQLETEDAESLERIRSGDLSTSEYFEQNLDWKFGEWCLNDIGNSFTSTYYDEYLNDIADAFPDVVYGVAYRCDYGSINRFLDGRMEEYFSGNFRKAKRKPWWKFW